MHVPWSKAPAGGPCCWPMPAVPPRSSTTSAICACAAHLSSRARLPRASARRTRSLPSRFACRIRSSTPCTLTTPTERTTCASPTCGASKTSSIAASDGRRRRGEAQSRASRAFHRRAHVKERGGEPVAARPWRYRRDEAAARGGDETATTQHALLQLAQGASLGGRGMGAAVVMDRSLVHVQVKDRPRAGDLSRVTGRRNRIGGGATSAVSKARRRGIRLACEQLHRGEARGHRDAIGGKSAARRHQRLAAAMIKTPAISSARRGMGVAVDQRGEVDDEVDIDRAVGIGRRRSLVNGSSGEQMRLGKVRLVPLTAVPDSPRRNENIAQMPQELHLEGFGFPEGPVALADGRIVFVDLLHQNVRRYFRRGSGSSLRYWVRPTGHAPRAGRNAL